MWTSDDKFFFLSLKLSAVPKKSHNNGLNTDRGMAYSSKHKTTTFPYLKFKLQTYVPPPPPQTT